MPDPEADDAAYGNSLDNILTDDTTLASVQIGNEIFNFEGYNTLVGGSGNDTYYVNYDNDTIIENSGEGTADTVMASVSYTLPANVENITLTGAANINATGNSEDNILTGNLGANVLTGGAGNDTYVFGKGCNLDTVNDTSGTNDTILFDNTVSQNDVAFFMNGNDLEIGFAGTFDQVTVQGQNSGNTIENFDLNDGHYLTSSDVNNIISNMSTYAANNSVSFNSLNDVESNQNLMNIIASSWHAA